MNPLDKLNKRLGKLAQGGIRLYQKTLSPDKGVPSLRLKGRVCAHVPHCSAYCKECFERYGFWPGFLYTVDRISSCTPSQMKHYDPPFYKVVFFSSAPIGVPFLEQLSKDKRFEVVGVVTAPDKPVGRGLEVKPNVIKKVAQDIGISDDMPLFVFEHQDNWNRIISGEKTIETRRAYIQGINRNINTISVGDHMLFQHKSTRDTLEVKVEKVYYRKDFQDFSQEADHVLKKTRPEQPLSALHDAKALESLRNFSGTYIQDVKEYGMYGFEFSIIKKFTVPLILTPNKINPDKSNEGKEFAEQLEALDADFFVVIAYGKIMPQNILDIPKLGPVNVHGSLLPKYRGASPIQAALLNNDAMTGITIMYMDAKMDEGDEIAKLAFSIDFSRTAEDIIHKMTQIGPEFLCNTLRDFGKEHLSRKPQDHANATYCTKIEKEEGEIDPRNKSGNSSLQTIYHKYRAYYLRPKIYFLHNGKRVIIEKLVIDQTPTSRGDVAMVSRDNELHSSVVECIVKPEGKKAMSRDEFVRGYMP